jgi:hypothetical protein
VNGTFGLEHNDGIDEWLATHSRTAIAERYFNELGKLTA